MKIGALKCKCSLEPQPVTHYEKRECKDLPMPLPWLLAILQRNKSDQTHRDNNFTVTRLLTCPRSVAIEDNLPNVIDLRHLNSPTWGHAVHEFMHRNTPEGMYSEVRLPLEGQKPPLILGVPLRGTVDVLSGDTVVLEDYKCTSESSMKFKWGRKETAAIEVRAQASLYKILIEKCMPETKIQEAAIWNGAMTGARCPAPPWFRVQIDWLEEWEIGAIRPHGCDFTVEQIIVLYKEFHERLNDLRAMGIEPETEEWFDRVAEIIGKIPMVGKPMWRGSKCEKYCSVKDTCYGIEGITTI